MCEAQRWRGPSSHSAANGFVVGLLNWARLIRQDTSKELNTLRWGIFDGGGSLIFLSQLVVNKGIARNCTSHVKTHGADSVGFVKFKVPYIQFFCT